MIISNHVILIIITNENMRNVMDSKTLGMSLLVVFLMASSGAVVLVVDNRMNDDIEVVEEVKQEEIEEVDYPQSFLLILILSTDGMAITQQQMVLFTMKALKRQL